MLPDWRNARPNARVADAFKVHASSSSTRALRPTQVVIDRTWSPKAPEARPPCHDALSPEIPHRKPSREARSNPILSFPISNRKPLTLWGAARVPGVNPRCSWLPPSCSGSENLGIEIVGPPAIRTNCSGGDQKGVPKLSRLATSAPFADSRRPREPIAGGT